MANNTFISQAIDIVKQAIEADTKGEYENALGLYKKSLDYFMAGLKYEKNPQTKATISARVEGYMKRAEDLKAVVDKDRAAAANRGKKGGGGGGTATRNPGEDEEKEDEEKNKLKGALSSSIVTEKPNVKWDDVAGLDLAKEALKEAVILPVKFPQLFVGKRKPWRGILLYGPPGTGKSYLAKAVATEADCKFFSVSSSDLVSKWQGESERLVRSLFEMAREEGRAIIFIDEVDSLCGQRSEGEADSVRRIKTEFLVQMDGVGKADPTKQVLILGATNIPWELDPAIRRRFEKRVYIPLPEASARAIMFKINLGDTPNSLTDEEFAKLADMTEGCSGADISICVREALME
ncbi:vacuolar protein sorting-associated protein, partial [Nannochloropsis oceanica]